MIMAASIRQTSLTRSVMSRLMVMLSGLRGQAIFQLRDGVPQAESEQAN